MSNIKIGDTISITNPHKLSSIKNKVVTCCQEKINDDGTKSFNYFIITNEETKNGNHSPFYHENFCKKLN